ncbi:ABC transporter substrate-binding protein [Saccharothrix sp. NRRL B-16348]|uniref:extracellular solute-binding protein n=1 Tax=Saccharothrix sp. NRRL B-16348 TaxID=1415542 RepID=UPI0006AE46D6|nr:extracellular solute-binding protein [Saccharothrix sp. NRRL B-16348]KOX16055.1 ABC transporter substrate-binding protein [Saccharothrix sp. NRRL B-16348]
MSRTTIGIGVASLFLLAACGAPTAGPTPTYTSVPEKPAAPVELNVLDVAGNLQLTQGMIDEFVAANPDVVGKVNYTKATAPDMPGKLKAEQSAGRSQTHLVLTGTDGLAAVVGQGLAARLLPDQEARFPGLRDNYLPPAAAMQDLAQGQGIAVTYYPAGPLLEYDPAKVPSPPKTADGLLAWAKANPGKFQYAVPANSGPGRTFLMGLPYILGDKDPKDPENGWEKTWAYLAELGRYVDHYPSGTTETMKNLANGTANVVATTTGWDINPRVLGTVPETMKVTTLEGFTWVTDAHYAVVPKGVSQDVMAANLALIKWMLDPQQQAKAYDKGYFYPGPAVKGVTLDMAPEESRDALAKFGRPEYDALIENHPKETSLPAEAQVKAFQKWEREIGSGKTGK